MISPIETLTQQLGSVNRAAWLKFSRLITTILAMSGILLDRVTLPRILVWVLIGCNIGFLSLYESNLSDTAVFVFFGLLFVIRYVVLFGSFGNNGLAPRLIRRFGEERGYDLYENLTAFLFFYRATSLDLFLKHTAGSLALPHFLHLWATGLAWATIAGASVINVWATLIVGVDVYYYKDMFVRRPVGTFEMRGPFRYFSNPMYGIGQLSAYGAALLYGSLWGLLAAVANQVLMYVFYYAFELPHIRRLFGTPK